VIERRSCERRHSYLVTASGAVDVNGVRLMPARVPSFKMLMSSGSQQSWIEGSRNPKVCTYGVPPNDELFPGVNRSRTLNVVKGIPLWPVLGSPVGGIGARARPYDFCKAEKQASPVPVPESEE
jgi:hypothetical protein